MVPLWCPYGNVVRNVVRNVVQNLVQNVVQNVVQNWKRHQVATRRKPAKRECLREFHGIANIIREHRAKCTQEQCSRITLWYPGNGANDSCRTRHGKGARAPKRSAQRSAKRSAKHSAKRSAKRITMTLGFSRNTKRDRSPRPCKMGALEKMYCGGDFCRSLVVKGEGSMRGDHPLGVITPSGDHPQA